MRKLWFLASFPPPVGGKAIINELMARKFLGRFEVGRLDLSSGTLERGLPLHAKRLRRAASATLLYVARARRDAILYVSLDGGLGMLYQLPSILVARLRNHAVAVHHHSFAYITHGSAPMRLLVRCLPPHALHVFLCGCMAELYRRRYADERGFVVLSNIEFFRKVEARPALSPGGTLVVGLIAQLSGAKGADTFLRLLARAGELGLPVRGVLAGPFSDAREEPGLRAAIARLGARVDYVGEVGGAAKDEFFGRLDVFLFPTRFRDEAQPLVLFEAASRGIPVVSHDRGCIAEDSAGTFHLIGPDEDFVEPALSKLREWIEHPDRLAAARDASLRQVDRLREAAAGQMEALLDRLQDMEASGRGRLGESRSMP